MVGTNAFASLEHRIEGRLVRIGADADNDLVLAHQSVSAHHAMIRRSRGSYYIRDLGSTNGTFLNGRRIESEQPLRPGDEMRFGAARFAMVAGGRSASSMAKFLGAATVLVLLAGAGFLAFEFVNNWENLEQLASTSAPREPASASVTATPAAVASPAKAAPPAAESLPAPMAAAPPWLNAINEYRAAVNLPPVAEDPKLSDADRKHATYVVKNYEDKVTPGHLIGAEMHDEKKGNPWYTTEGHDAGAQSDVNQLWGSDGPPSPTWALDNWISGPFHRLWILNPRLHRVGYGEFCEKKYCVAALDLGGGTDPAHGAAPLASPIEFPADKSIITLNSFSGEWPTPLTACAGFSFPAGMPATIELGTEVEAKLSEYQITRDGHGVEACGIDAATYQNPVSAEQERGRAILRELGAAMVIPRHPLRPGRYSVTATVNDHAYQWSFTVAATKDDAAPPAGAESAASKASRKDEFEAALREGYARVAKGDSESREDYERYIKQRQAADAAKAAAAVARANDLKRQHDKAAEDAKKQAAMVASYEAASGVSAVQNREIQRLGQSAFPLGPGAVAPAGQTEWLTELNRDRAAVDLPPLTEDPALSDGALKHSNYLVMNYPTPRKMGAEMHSEDPSKPGYTTEGLAAAKGNVAPSWYFTVTPDVTLPKMEQLLFLNGWLEAPFHRPSMLRPDIHKAGFGESCEGIACAAGLDTPEARLGAAPTKFAQPILFPPPKYPFALDELPGEWPNPLTACPNYAFPVGVPITIQLGVNVDAKLTSYALTQASKAVEACGFDAATYSNPNPEEMKRAVGGMKLNGEVVIVPRKTLERGATYEVSATVNDQPYSWSFTVSR